MTGQLRERWERAVSCLRRRHADDELDAEFASHHDEAVDDLIRRGMTLDEARRCAALKFGSRVTAREHAREQRGAPWLEGLLYDLRFAVRGLGRDWTFSLAAITMLALAIALNTTAFTVMDAMLFRGSPHLTRSDRLVFLGVQKPSDSTCCLYDISYTDFEVWRSQARAFEGVAFRSGGGGTVTFREGEGRPIDVNVQRVSANTLEVLGVRPVVGRDFVPTDESTGAAPVALLGYGLWQRRFGKRADVIGSIVHINDTPATIVGVIPEGVVLSASVDDKVWMPVQRTPGLAGAAIGRLRDAAPLGQARTELDTINRRLQASDPATPRGTPKVFTHSRFYLGADAPMIYGSLWVGAWFVLLIACANLANLTLVRTTGRWREFSTRIALGASIGRTIRQILVEHLLLASVAGALGWWITRWSVRAWETTTASPFVPMDYTVDASIGAYLAAISVAAALIVSLVPIARVMPLGVSGALKGDARGVTQSLRGKHLAAGLVAGQMALAIMLLLGAGVLVRSFENVVGADTGVRDPEHILVGLLHVSRDKFPTPASRLAYFNRLEAELSVIPGVAEATVASTTPVNSGLERPFEIEGTPRPEDVVPHTQLLSVGSNYFRVVNVPVVAGRAFANGDADGALPVAIVNQSFADQFLAGGQPLGRQLRVKNAGTSDSWRTVVGVVRNIMQGDGPRQQFKPVVYVPVRQEPPAYGSTNRGGFVPGANVLLRTNVPPDRVAQAVRAVIQRLDADVSVEDFSTLKASYGFERDRMDLEHAELAKYAGVAPIFALIALLLAGIGLVAVIAHSVTQRTKEIGVRMAIGAAANDIRRMVLREGMTPVAIGMVLGLTASLVVNRLLQSQLVRVSPYDPTTMAAAPAILLLVALLACQIPARRAMRVEPMVALRHE